MKTLPEYKDGRSLVKLEALGAEIEFEAQDEDISPFGQFDDDDTAQRICDKYNNGNIWAWFCAKVTVKYRGLEATDYLGCCSYRSREDFIKNSGYYVDMVNQCIDEINKDIADYNAEILKQWEIRKAKNILSKYGLFVAAAL